MLPRGIDIQKGSGEMQKMSAEDIIERPSRISWGHRIKINNE